MSFLIPTFFFTFSKSPKKKGGARARVSKFSTSMHERPVPTCSISAAGGDPHSAPHRALKPSLVTAPKQRPSAHRIYFAPVQDFLSTEWMAQAFLNIILPSSPDEHPCAQASQPINRQPELFVQRRAKKSPGFTTTTKKTEENQHGRSHPQAHHLEPLTS